MKILITGGARPNFMKIAPLVRAMKKYDNIEFKLIHTGQHYDYILSKVFFEEFELPEPYYYLNVGSCDHGEQTGRIMIEFEKICKLENPDIVVVIGDVNSTAACALVSSKLHIKTAHIESGLRSFDKKMPEEINRLVADICSDYLFCTIEEAATNLLKEQIHSDNIYLVGDSMIDNLLYYYNKVRRSILKSDNYDAMLTLHRPSNVDNKKTFKRILKAIEFLSTKYRIRFPIHPRTRKMLDKYNLNEMLKNCIVSEPIGYLEMLSLLKSSKTVITDSGGLQIESALLKIPCITLRENTEQTDTLSDGHNILVGSDTEKIIKEVEYRINNDLNLKDIDDGLRDGNVANRIIEILLNKDNKKIDSNIKISNITDDEFDFGLINKYTDKGHTDHCSKRIVWGDGECECKYNKSNQIPH